MTKRAISDIRQAMATQDGAGVAIDRVGLMGDPSTDPVLMIDELRSPFRKDFEAGFPPHPHRGMQTLTYMREGGIIHEDSLGNRGEIRSGGVQWMSAGRGVIHSEMPTQDTQGLHGFQLWFNLPAAEKMDPPRYRDIARSDLNRLDQEGFAATAIAGAWHLNGESVTGPLEELVPQASMMDLNVGSNQEVTLSIRSSDTALAYVYDGSVITRDGSQGAKHLLIATGGDRWTITAGAGGAGLLVLTGRPIGETVVGYGPFVMNSEAEIQRAIRDYQTGVFINPAV